MRRLLKFVLVVALAILGFAFWWLMPLKVERTFLGNISPNFRSWCATDLDKDNSPEILLSYANKPPVLLRLQRGSFETVNLSGVNSVVLPSPKNPQGLLLPFSKSVPAKAKGQFWLMRLEKGLVSLQPFPKVERPDHVAWLDADNDGKFNDLIVRSGERRFWFVMDESGEWRFKAQLPLGPKRPLIGVADFDKDGKHELVMGGQNYSVLWGDGKPETKLGSNLELSEVQVTDLDNDGQMEVIALKREGLFVRLVVWKFQPLLKRLVVSASPQFEPHTLITANGQKFPLALDNLWVADLDGDGLKEAIVYASDYRFSNIMTALVIHTQPKAWSLLPGSTPVFTMPFPSPKHLKVSFSASPWLLILSCGKQFTPRKIEPMKEAQQPVTCFRLRNQSLLLTEQWKHLRRFHPRFHSFNPLVVTWWEEGVLKQGTLWRVSEIAGAKVVRYKKVLDLPGSPRLTADFNGDEVSEILWVRELVSTFGERVIVGITAWKLGRWRKAAWVLAERRQQQISLTPSSILIVAQSFLPQQIRLLPIKTEKGFDLLIASPDGAVERIKFK